MPLHKLRYGESIKPRIKGFAIFPNMQIVFRFYGESVNPIIKKGRKMNPDPTSTYEKRPFGKDIYYITN